MKNIIKSYADFDIHRKIGALIKKHSENSQDIRDVVNSAINWPHIHTILDLGCGYGWFEERLEGKFDYIMGIDCHPSNEQAFLSITMPLARTSVFVTRYLPSPIDVPADFFDLVASAYSLYFFPEVLPVVKRVLKPEGIFLVITHSEAMLEEGEMFFQFDNLRKVIQNFSAENGIKILSTYFTDITIIDYYNNIIFNKEEKEDLEQYIDFKKEFIAKDVDHEVVKTTMLCELDRRGILRFNKNDRIFLASK